MRGKMEDQGYQFLLDEASKKYKEAGYNYFIGGFSELAGSFINYQALKTDTQQLKLQAQSIENQALEKANRIREQFLEAAGSYQYGAAARNISVGSGSVRDNLMSSSENLGKDISRMRDEAGAKARSLRSQAKILKTRGKTQLISGLLNSASSFASGYDAFSSAPGTK